MTVDSRFFSGKRRTVDQTIALCLSGGVMSLCHDRVVTSRLCGTMNLSLLDITFVVP